MRIIILISILISLSECKKHILDKGNKEYIVLPFNQSDFTTFISVNDNKTDIKLSVDTMSFYTMIFGPYIEYTGKYYKDIKCFTSYRLFIGLENYLYLSDHKDISGYFSHVLLQEFTNKPNYFEVNVNTTNGVLGLARNYTSDVVVAESYFFGVSASFSIMNYLTSNNLLNVSMFSIYKDKLILGDVPIAKEDRSNVKICKPINFLDETFELFFWNCEANFINIFGVTEESRFGEYFIIDTLLKGINLPLRLKEKVGEYLNKVTDNKCTVKSTIICDGSIDIESIGNVSLILKGNITVTIPSYELFYKSYDQYHSLVTFSEYNHMYIFGGKLLTNKYFLMFNNKDNYIGFADINSIRLIFTNETAETIIKLNILFLLIQITMLLYFKIYNSNNK